MSEIPPALPVGGGAVRRTLTTRKIVMLVLAGVAPLTVMVSVMPLGFAFGGASLPVMYVVAGVILLCFSVGFAELSKQLPVIDGLWSYVRAGLGRIPAGGAALLALFGYAAVLLGAVGATAYFFQSILGSELGFKLGWYWYALALALAIGLLAWRQIDLSARVVGVLVLAEMAVVVLVVVIVVVRSGASAFPPGVASWHTITEGSPGVGLMYAFISFLAFEAAALFASEAKDPNRSVPRATLISVTVIAGFFVLCSWVIAGGFGVHDVVAAANQQGGQMIFSLAGTAVRHVLSVVLLTSLFATTLGLTNITARYTQVVASEGLLPRRLAVTHAVHGAPSRAAATTVVVEIVVISLLALAGADPYIDISGLAFGIGVLGVVAVQFLASVSVVVYYRRNGVRSQWRHAVAPVLGCVGLLAALTLIATSFSAVTGKTDGYIAYLPLAAIVPLAAGAVLAARSGRRRAAERASAPTGVPGAAISDPVPTDD